MWSFGLTYIQGGRTATEHSHKENARVVVEDAIALAIGNRHVSEVSLNGVHY